MRAKVCGGNLVIERPQFIPHQLDVWFSSVLRHVYQLSDPLTQVFVSHNKELEKTVPHLSCFTVSKETGIQDTRSFSGSPTSATA